MCTNTGNQLINQFIQQGPPLVLRKGTVLGGCDCETFHASETLVMGIIKMFPRNRGITTKIHTDFQTAEEHHLEGLPSRHHQLVSPIWLTLLRKCTTS